MGNHGTACRQHRSRADQDVFQHYGIHPDDRAVLDLARFERRSMADSDTSPNRRAAVKSNVDNSVILDVTSSADHDALLPVIAAQNRSVPNAGILVNNNVSYQYRGRRHERAGCDLWSVTVEFHNHLRLPFAPFSASLQKLKLERTYYN